MGVIGTPLGSMGAELSYDPIRGEMMTRRFDGTMEACMARAMALRAERPDISFTLTPSDPPLWSLVVRSPDFSETRQSDADVPTSWELLGNDIQKDLWESGLAASISEAEEAKIRNALANKNKLPTDPTETWSAAGTRLWFLLKKGTTHFQLSQWVIRGSRILKTDTDVRISLANCERVFTTAQMISAEGIPAALAFTVEEIPTPVAPNPLYNGAEAIIYHSGWLKKTPTAQLISGNRLLVQQEYWLNSWAIDLYPAIE